MNKLKHVTLVMLAIALIALLIGIFAPSILAPWFYFPQNGDYYSYKQLFADILLIPIVVIGFYLAIREFRKSQEKPDLDLWWEITGEKLKSTTIKYHQHEPITHISRSLLITNNGNAVTSWFKVTFCLPSDLTQSRVYTADGNKEVWETKTYWSVYSHRAQNCYSFKSNGEIASYPGSDEPLCQISFRIEGNISYGAEYQIPYDIYSDRGKKKEGHLVLIVGKI